MLYTIIKRYYWDFKNRLDLDLLSVLRYKYLISYLNFSQQ